MDIGDVSGSAYAWDAATAVTTAVDIWEAAPFAGGAQKVGGFMLSQTSDLGDAQHEVINVQWVHGHETSGSGGGTPTGPAFLGSADVQWTITALECRNTTPASTGTTTKGKAHGWNTLTPLDVWYPNGLEPFLYSGGGTLYHVLRMLASPADSLTMFSDLTIRGGYFASN